MRSSRGDCLGEVAIFEPGRASATATCREEGQLWCMDAEHLQQFLLESPHGGCALILGINTLLSRRLKRANATIKTNAIVPRFLSVRSRTRAGARGLTPPGRAGPVLRPPAGH